MKTMENNFVIVHIPIDQIKRDETQPRTYFDKESLKNLAESIRKDGFINAIEIDSNRTIITGERRYRAAQMLGLKTVPCKIIDIKDDHDKFRRQMAENVHQYTMTDYDIARGLLKLSGNQDLDKINASQIADELGMSRSWAREKLALLKMSEKFQNAVKNGLSGGFVRAILLAKEKYKPLIEKKILANEFESRESAWEVTKAINNYPYYANKLLKKDYKDMSYRDVVAYLNKIIPNYTATPLADKFDKSIVIPDQMMSHIYALRKLLKENSAKSIGLHHARSVAINLNQLDNNIAEWLGVLSKPQLT